MVITKIEKQKKTKTNRYNLYCDDLFVCGISEKTIAQNFLYENKIIDNELLEEIIEKDKLNYGMNYAYNLISYSPRTSFELKNKLLQKGVSEEHCLQIINKLIEYNYINDEDYLKNYVSNCILKKQGILKIKQGLLQKGFEKQIINEYVEDFFNQNNILDNNESLILQIENNIKNLILKKEKSLNYFNENDNLTKRKKKEKIIRYLLSKGYEYEQISKELDILEKYND